MPVLNNRSDVERFIRNPDQRVAVVLFYGPDHGLIIERSTALALASTANSTDPVQMIRLEGEAVAADPLSLADEANTMSMFGGRRAVRVRAANLRGGTRVLVPAIKPLLDTPPLDSIVIIEAGDLKKSDPLVVLVSAAADALVIPCYGDEARDLGDIINDAVRQAGKAIDADARSLLQTLAGGDRIATRGEIGKLLLFVGDAARISVEDVAASVGDTANAMMDHALDGAFGGDVSVMMGALDRLKREGADPNMLLLRALSHAWRLAQVIESLRNSGRSGDSWKMISTVFTRKALIERSLQNWTPEALIKYIRAIGDAVQSVRVSPRLSDAAVDRTFLSIALAARKAK